MKNMLLAAAAVAVLSVSALAAQKTYQVTGPVLDVKDGIVTVEKGKAKWELAVDAAQAATVNTGDKVTIEYTMTVKSITVKADKAAAKKADKPAKKK